MLSSHLSKSCISKRKEQNKQARRRFHKKKAKLEQESKMKFEKFEHMCTAPLAENEKLKQGLTTSERTKDSESNQEAAKTSNISFLSSTSYLYPPFYSNSGSDSGSDRDMLCADLDEPYMDLLNTDIIDNS
jgi:hypothetical protein